MDTKKLPIDRSVNQIFKQYFYWNPLKAKEKIFTVSCTWSGDIVSESVRHLYNISDVVFDVL